MGQPALPWLDMECRSLREHRQDKRRSSSDLLRQCREVEKEEAAVERIRCRLSLLEASLPHALSSGVRARFDLLAKDEETARERARFLPPPPFATDAGRRGGMGTGQGRVWAASRVENPCKLEEGVMVVAGESCEVVPAKIVHQVVWQIVVCTFAGPVREHYTTESNVRLCAERLRVDSSLLGGALLACWGEFQLAIPGEAFVRFP